MRRRLLLDPHLFKIFHPQCGLALRRPRHTWLDATNNEHNTCACTHHCYAKRGTAGAHALMRTPTKCDSVFLRSYAHTLKINWRMLIGRTRPLHQSSASTQSLTIIDKTDAATSMRLIPYTECPSTTPQTGCGSFNRATTRHKNL